MPIAPAGSSHQVRCISMRSFLVYIIRHINALRRSSGRSNRRLLQRRKEDINSSFIFRDATSEDVPELARVHVLAWNDTYPNVRKPPGYELREWQWRDIFTKQNDSWFIILVEKKAGGLVGFARGARSSESEGDLNKIYLLREYQQVGLGKRLLGVVVYRFLAMGIHKMHVIAEAGNPSCWFYEKMGGKNMRNKDGSINYGNYEWDDLEKLAAKCK